jgi:GIY-YIG catalytic domain
VLAYPCRSQLFNHRAAPGGPATIFPWGEEARVWQHRAISGAYIYILGSHTGTLYIGVTSNLYLRVMQHKEGTREGFTATYGRKPLLYFEG